MRSRTESWEHQRQRQINDFIGGWTWEQVISYWRHRLADFSIDLDPLFQRVAIHDPANPVGRQSEIAWWPTKLIHTKQMDCQRHFDEHPGTRGLTHPDSCRSSVGEATTIEHLWQNKSDPAIVAAILFSASLFSRIGSARKHYPEDWPPIFAVKVLADWAYERWLGAGRHEMWHYSCTTVLPWSSEDYAYKIDSMHALVRYLAEEHASLLLQYRPVVIEFTRGRDHFIASALDQERKAREQRMAQWKNQRKAEATAEERRLEAMKLQHPRHGEWTLVSANELERLVWSKATSQLAAEFGVSDVAIGKRCKALGIVKPPQGFWNKVAAGKIPHPQGKSPTTGLLKGENPKLKIVRGTAEKQ